MKENQNLRVKVGGSASRLMGKSLIIWVESQVIRADVDSDEAGV